ncbi:MAG: MATE family efflux transporter [Tissierellia bacterium]|nr:MATE family efflux transporter [Tissierellia bacterium]
MEKDLTKGTEWKTILLFAIPIMGSNLLQIGYNLADSIIVGNFVSSTALGAIGVTSSTIWLLLNIVTGIGTGTSITLSQYFGAKREKDIESTISTVLIFSVITSLCITAFCFIFARFIIWNFLGTPAEMYENSYKYFVIYGSGMIFQMIYNVVYGILRAHGNSKGSLIFLLVAGILNVAFDFLFVVVFKWGVSGAALATIISQAGSAIASVIYMWKLFPHLKFKRSQWVFEKKKLIIVLRLAVPIILQSSVIAFGFILLQKLINSFGPASIEGFVAMNKAEQLMHIPSNAFNVAISNFTGHNIGAKQTDRIKKGYRSTIIMGSAFCIVMVIFTFFYGKNILRMFNITDEAMIRGSEHLYTVAAFMIFSTINNITGGLLQGAGDVKVTTIAGFVNLTIRLVTAYTMATTAINFRSIYFSLPPAWIVACLITVTRYRSGKWKTKAIS